MSFLAKWKEFRAASHRAHIAKVESDLADAGKPGALREIEIADMMHKIRALMNENARRNPGRNIVLDIQPGAEDDREIFDEAMRRIKQELRP